MNNLIERLHASFFFFILTTPDRFLKIGSYLPSALLISVAMMFGGLKAWNDASPPSAIEAKTVEDTKHVQPNRNRRVLNVLALMAYTHILGALLFWLLTSTWYLNKSHVRLFLVSLGLHSPVSSRSPLRRLLLWRFLWFLLRDNFLTRRRTAPFRCHSSHSTSVWHLRSYQSRRWLISRLHQHLHFSSVYPCPFPLRPNRLLL